MVDLEHWITKLMKEATITIEEKREMIDYGNELYKTLPSYKWFVAESNYNKLMQIKHQFVYDRVIEWRKGK